MPSTAHLTLYGLIAFCATVVLILLLKRPAEHAGLVDRPDGRKYHEGAVPLCGGPAMAIVFSSSVIVFGLMSPTDYFGLLTGAMILALVGAVDDLRGLSVHFRLFVQIVVVLTCMGLWGNMELATLGDLLGSGDIQLGHAAVPVTLFCVVGMINAFNLSDGLDGLAGGIAVIASTSFAVAALAAGEFLVVAPVIVLLGVSLGFLVFNLRTSWRARASVFMGDSGSLFLGFALCWFAINLSQGDGRAISAVSAGWILAVPIMDTLNVMLSRIMRGVSPCSAGRDHLHHALLQAGFSPKQAVQILLAAGVVTSITALAAHWQDVAESIMFFTFFFLFVIYFFCMRSFWRSRALAAVAASDGAIMFNPHEEMPGFAASISPPPASLAPANAPNIGDLKDGSVQDVAAAGKGN